MPITADPQIAKLGVKLPPLWKNNIKMWFIQAECNFQLSGITADLTKYNNIVAAIDSETLSAVSDILLNPPNEDKYSTLKQRLIQEFSDSENLQIRKLLSELQLGDDKPSHLLRKMRELAGTALSDDFLKTLWFQRLPTDMQSILSVSTETLENLAKLADKIAEVRCDPLNTVYAMDRKSVAANPSRVEQTNASSSPLCEISALRAEIASLSKQFERFTARGRNSRSRSRGRFSKSPRRPIANHSEICYYHERFGKNARKCRDPCSFSNDDQGN